jgi:glutathione S-transferase
MKLYITPTSPYGRLARIVVIEKGLTDKVEIIAAQTREVGSPYYAINPSGRVPYLVRDDGVGMEDSQLIAMVLDNLDGRPRLAPPLSMQDYAYGRLETYARSMVDGISVWVREMRRPENERSPTVLAHEADRAKRLADHWEREINHPLMQGPLNIAQILLVVGIDFASSRSLGDLDKDRPKLATWIRRLREVPSIKATRPVA